MTETEQERKNRYKADPLFRHWTSVLMSFSRANKAPCAIELWHEAEQAAIRLAHETDWRDGEVEFIYDDLSRKYGPESHTPACVMAILLTLLADATPKGGAGTRSPYAPVECAIVNILGEDATFNGLLEAFFARRRDNQMRKVEFPVIDYLEDLKDSEREIAEESSTPHTASAELEQIVANALKWDGVNELKALKTRLCDLGEPSITGEWIKRINARIEQLIQALGTPRVETTNVFHPGASQFNQSTLQNPTFGNLSDEKLKIENGKSKNDE